MAEPIKTTSKSKSIIPIKKQWEFDDSQGITVYNKNYNIHAALMQARDLEIVEIPISQMYISYKSPCDESLRSFIQHMIHVNEADLSYPILLNEDGFVIDGRHRLAKAILNGEEKIKTKRFKEDPSAIFEWV